MPPSTRAASTQPGPQDAEPVRVLIVDDNHVNLELMRRALKVHMGDTIQYTEIALSGEGALQLLHERVFDLVLLDIDMPILNGIDTARHIRSSTEYNILNQNRAIPIVAVTTNDTSEWKQQYVQAGINGCISKPVAAAILKRIITQVLTNGSSPESLLA